MENHGTPPSAQVPYSGIQFSLAPECAAETTQEAAPRDLNPTTTLEIVVDSSDLFHDGVPREGVELSIVFEKNNEEEGLQSALADHLDGVEVRVSLDSTQTMGVEVLSSRNRDHPTPQQDLQLALEGPYEDPQVLNLGEDMLPASNMANQLVENDAPLGTCGQTSPAATPCTQVGESNNVVETYDKGDENQCNDKKRSREEMEENGRCLKSKTMESSETAVLEGVPVSGIEARLHAEHSEHGIGEIFATQSLDAKDSSGMHLEDSTSLDANTCNKETTKKTIDASVAVEPCSSMGVDKEESTEKVSDAGVESVCDKTNTAEDGGRARPRKKRKIAMLLAYCGAGYQGMQKNPGAVTIEGELEQALTKAGAMPENFDGNPRKVDWMRAARTDKGVSAVGQVVSGLFYIDPPGFVERVNEHLPQQIRLLGIRRVIPTFSAKKYCDRRRYEYVVPIFALDASAHRDREAVLASEGKEGGLMKCLECSERGRKIPAGKGSNDMKVEVGLHRVGDGPSPSAPETINGIVTPCIAEQALEESLSLEAEAKATSELSDSASLTETVKVEESGSDSVSESKKEIFHFGEAERTKLNRLLNYYVGTHNFHNFTSRVKAEDPSAKRYMVSFEAGDVFTAGNMEFVRCTVVGQSFMLHQIRKMIGLVIAVFRGCAPESILETALRRDANITIPTAPELGLFLDECMYPAYNQKWYNTHEEVSQKGYEPAIARFKHEVIYEHIAATEYKEGQMALFLHSLNDRNYADFAAARVAEKQPVVC